MRECGTAGHITLTVQPGRAARLLAAPRIPLRGNRLIDALIDIQLNIPKRGLAYNLRYWRNPVLEIKTKLRAFYLFPFFGRSMQTISISDSLPKRRLHQKPGNQIKRALDRFSHIRGGGGEVFSSTESRKSKRSTARGFAGLAGVPGSPGASFPGTNIAQRQG